MIAKTCTMLSKQYIQLYKVRHASDNMANASFMELLAGPGLGDLTGHVCMCTL